MQPDEGYQEAQRLLKSRYGQSYKIATAYVNRVTNGPPIRHEVGEALQKFSVILMSCKNTLKEISCLNKIENPDSLQRVVERLPFQLRQRWRDVADDITSNKQRNHVRGYRKIRRVRGQSLKSPDIRKRQRRTEELRKGSEEAQTLAWR